MSKPVNYDFSGWATRNDILCTDGRTIRHNAFISCDGKKVPLVWMHQHNDPAEVLGHAVLENRNDGVYMYGTFNNTEKGQIAKELVQNGDVTSLSIYANGLKHNGRDVVHGNIREVSLVLAGANVGAFIDNVVVHGEELYDEATIYVDEVNNAILFHSDEDEDVEETIGEAEETEDDNYEGGSEMFDEQNMKHADADTDTDKPNNGNSDNEETIGDIIETMSEKQKTAMYALMAMLMEGDKKEMKHNVFDATEDMQDDVLSHAEMEQIFGDAKRFGSLSESVLQHGITNIEYLFPDAKTINNAPDWIKREDDWVSKVMNGVHKTPFSRIKSMFADITEDEARAKGYIKGKKKKEEVFALLKRTTGPTTIYKKQKLDRDDVIDITDFDVVAWLKTEMRMMLNEEIARAILIGDGRLAGTDDKIDENCIRPIATDNSLYTVKHVVNIPASKQTDLKYVYKEVIRSIIRSRKDYKGSGNPTFWTTEDALTEMLLIEDENGRVIYDTEEKLRTALRQKEIVTVPVMENYKIDDDQVIGLYVNLNDYNVGADKGGAVNMFDDFDIDYNAQKYLIETRCSGALIKPYSAVVIVLHITEE